MHSFARNMPGQTTLHPAQCAGWGGGGVDHTDKSVFKGLQCYSEPKTNCSSLKTSCNASKTNYNAPKTNCIGLKTDYNAPKTNCNEPKNDCNALKTNYSAPKTNYNASKTP